MLHFVFKLNEPFFKITLVLIWVFHFTSGKGPSRVLLIEINDVFDLKYVHLRRYIHVGLNTVDHFQHLQHTSVQTLRGNAFIKFLLRYCSRSIDKSWNGFFPMFLRSCSLWRASIKIRSENPFSINMGPMPTQRAHGGKRRKVQLHENGDENLKNDIY